MPDRDFSVNDVKMFVGKTSDIKFFFFKSFWGQLMCLKKQWIIKIASFQWTVIKQNKTGVTYFQLKNRDFYYFF